MKTRPSQDATTEFGGARRDRFLCLLLALITLALYAPVRNFELNNYDDAQYITKNPHVLSGLTAENIAWAFTSGYASNWHPLTWLSHQLDCQLFGLNAGGPHLVNLLLHTANTLLLFLLMRRMTGAVWRAAFVAAVFAWHPLHVESVAWVAERKDVLSTFFWLLTLLAYVKYVETSRVQNPKSKKFYGLALGLYILGLLSKPMVVSLPFILLLLDFWPLKRIGLDSPADRKPKSGPASADPAPPQRLGRLILEKIPFFILSAALCVVTFLVQRSSGAVHTLETVSINDRIANALVSYLRYIGKLFWPVDLAVIYPYSHHLPVGLVIASAVVLGLISWVSLARMHGRPWLFSGWFWFIITLGPVIGLVQVGDQAMADRYSYIPSIGWFMLVAWEASAWAAKWSNGPRMLAAAAGVSLAGCLVGTTRQLPYWQNGVTLFEHAVRVTKENAVAHCNLGAALAAEERRDEALGEFNEALRIRPDYAEAIFNKGVYFYGEDKIAEAIELYNQALKLRPDWSHPRGNLGLALLKLGRMPEAIEQLRRAAQEDTTDDKIFTNLGLALAQQGKLDEAIIEYRHALKLAANPYAENALGGALDMQGRLAEAAEHYQAALELKPDFQAARLNLANMLMQTGKGREAVQNYRSVLQSDPHSALALTRLAWILATNPDPQLRNGAEAVQLATRATEQNGGTDPAAWDAKAAACAEAGQFIEAVSAATKAGELAKASQNKDLAAQIKGRIELYQTGRAFHENARPVKP